MGPHRTSRRRLSLAAPALFTTAWLAATGLVACGEGSDEVSPTTTEATTPHQIARAACTSVIDERSEVVSREAAEAATMLRRTLQDGEEPPDNDIADVQDALGAERGQLADAQETLRAVELPAANQDDWATVVDAVDPVLAGLDDALAFLRDPDWDRRPDTVGLAAPTPDRVALDTALERLDLLGTDCQWVYDHPGVPSDTAPFHRDAVAACATTVERRRGDGFDPTADPGATWDTEWAATVDDLSAVDSGPLEDPAPWERVVEAARAAAAGETPDDVTADLEELGIDRRPCAALWPVP